MVDCFKGKRCVFMGSAQYCERKGARDELVAVGGIIDNDVTSFTDFVIAFKGAEKTKKYEKVMRYEKNRMLCVLKEQQFLAILDGKMPAPELHEVDSGVVIYKPEHDEVYYNDELLNKDDFTFDIFSTNEIGDSGVLKIATLKSDKTVQYIIKSESSVFGCNEFMYHHVAKALGLYTQEVRLFKNEDGKVLYPVGIRYADGIKGFSYKKAKNDENKRDFHRFETLYYILNEEDSHEYYTDKHGKLFKLDNAAAFNMTFMTYGFVTTKSNDLPVEFRHCGEYAMRNADRVMYDIYIESLPKYYGQEAVEISMETFRAFSELDMSLLENAFVTLGKVYPAAIVNYYREFLLVRKNECKQFVLEKSRTLKV